MTCCTGHRKIISITKKKTSRRQEDIEKETHQSSLRKMTPKEDLHKLDLSVHMRYA